MISKQTGAVIPEQGCFPCMGIMAFKTSILLPGRYYWRVYAFDGLNYSYPSRTGCFVIKGKGIE